MKAGFVFWSQRSSLHLIWEVLLRCQRPPGTLEQLLRNPQQSRRSKAPPPSPLCSQSWGGWCWHKTWVAWNKRGFPITWARTPLVQSQCKVESEPRVDCLSPTLRSPACFSRQRSLSRKTWDQDWSFTDLEIFVTWAPEPSGCPRRPSRCQPGGLEKMSGKLADC